MEATKPNEEKLITNAKELVRLISAVHSTMSSSFSSSDARISACAEMVYELSDPTSVDILIQCWNSDNLSWEDNQEVPTIVIAMMYKCLFFIYSKFPYNTALIFFETLSSRAAS